MPRYNFVSEINRHKFVSKGHHIGHSELHKTDLYRKLNRLRKIALRQLLAVDATFVFQSNISEMYPGAPGGLSRLSVRLRLRSRSHGLWVRAPRQALCRQLGAWNLLRILCLPLSLPLPHSCSVPLCLRNKH